VKIGHFDDATGAGKTLDLEARRTGGAPPRSRRLGI
jgi:hypothetical protein